MSGAPLPVVVLISGRGSNLQSIIERCADGTLAARVAGVISNEAGAAGLERARRAGIETALLEHRAYPSRAAFDAALAERVDGFRPGLVVLAGFMRILTPVFVDRFAGRLINIHPSLLPRFPGLDTHRRAIEAGEREHGATVHFVTGELDGGPIICQARVAVLAGDTPEVLAARVLEHEHRILPEAIGWFAAGRLRLAGGRALLDGEPIG